MFVVPVASTDTAHGCEQQHASATHYGSSVLGAATQERCQWMTIVEEAVEGQSGNAAPEEIDTLHVKESLCFVHAKNPALYWVEARYNGQWRNAWSENIPRTSWRFRRTHGRGRRTLIRLREMSQVAQRGDWCRKHDGVDRVQLWRGVVGGFGARRLGRFLP